MNIVTINGQNHKGSSYHIGRLLAESTGGEITEFFLPRDLNHFCLGCYSCVEDETKCPFWSEKKVIIDAIERADALIFTTPNYCLAPSGSMKAFLDLLFDLWMVHRPKEWMFRKRAVVISTAAGAPCGGVMKVMKSSLSGWGIPYIKTFGAALHVKSWDEVKPENKLKLEKKISRLAKELRREAPPRVGLKTRFMFNMMGKMHSAGWDSSPVEREYWDERGWLGHDRPWKRKK